MNPGQTIFPEASTSSLALASDRSPTAAILSPFIPTSLLLAEAPVPSTTSPCLIMTSNII